MSENLAISNTLYSVAGEEKLSLAETLKTFYAEVSLGVDKFNAAYLNSSIHIIAGTQILDKVKKSNSYFKINTRQFPTPSLYSPKKATFKRYVELCLQTLDLMTLANLEVDRVYDAIKHTAAKGNLPFTLRQWKHEKTLNALREQFDKTFYNDGVSTHPLNAIYPSINDAIEVFTYFNQQVKTLKSRDTEILKKKVDNLIAMLSILRRKIDAQDINFSPEEVKTIEVIIGRLNELIAFTGSMMALLNELTRVLELQINEFKQLT